MKGDLDQLRTIAALFLTGNRGLLLSGALLSAATALSGVALLGLSGWFITATAIAGLSAATAIAFYVFAPGAGIRLLALMRTGARYGERLATHDATLGVLAALREKLFRGWALSSPANTLVKRPARLLFRLTLDIDALDSLYLRILVPLAAALVVAVTSGIAFSFMHPLAGVAVAFFLISTGLVVPTVAARGAAKPARRKAHGLEILRSRISGLVSGQTEWIMAGQLRARRDDIVAVERYLGQTDDNLNLIETKAGVAFGIAGALLLAATLITMAMLAESGLITAPVAALGLLVSLAALEPFGALRRGAVELGRTLLGIRRITPRLTASQAEPSHPRPAPGVSVRLENITVRHDGASVALIRNLSLTLVEGQRVALIGPSGAGKSTLLAVMAGECLPERGRICGQPATLLTQRTELFQDSLRDNLLLADPVAPDDRLREVLAAAGLSRDVDRLPAGLDTRLGEGGQGLSGGQARRLALSRLFLRDTPIWLLDEPTEGLDGETARDVLDRLKARADERTIVIATHIRREAELADSLVMLERGAIRAVIHRRDPNFQAALDGLRPD